VPEDVRHLVDRQVLPGQQLDGHLVPHLPQNLHKAQPVALERSARGVRQSATDLVVIDRSPFGATPEQIAETTVVTTMMNGRIVYELPDP